MIKLVRDNKGVPKRYKETNNFIFNKDGVYFKLGQEELKALYIIIRGII